MSTNRTLARWLAGAIALYGLVSIFLRGVSLGDIKYGIRAAAVDPAFTVFSTVLLPIGVYFLLTEGLVEYITRALKGRLWPTLVFLGIIGLAIGFTVKDAYQAVCERISTPEMYSNSILKMDLQKLRIEQMAQVPTSLTDVSIKSGYEKRLKETWKGCCYWKSASFYAIYGAIGSVASALVAAAMLLFPFLPLLSGETQTRLEMEAYLAVVAQLAIWIALAPFSLWYLFFGSDWAAYEPLGVLLPMAVVAILAWGVFYLGDLGYVGAVRVGAGVIGLLGGIVPFYAPEITGRIGSYAFSKTGITVVIYYVLILLVCVLFARALKPPMVKVPRNPL